MASDDKNRPDDDALDILSKGAEQDLSAEERDALARLATDVEAPGLQDDILARYADVGRDLLSDGAPRSLDPRMIASLKPLLGDVSSVRVHSGKLATEAARVMDARAFAIGDRDIFLDGSEFSMNSAAGRSLIAHEVAHTKDASTGFAMSANSGASDVSRREAFAEETAAQYEASERGGGSESASDGSSPDAPKMPKIPKARLARMIAKVIEKQMDRNSDRTGSVFSGDAT